MIRDELEGFLKDSIVPRLEQAWLNLEADRVREDERAMNLVREREARKKAEQKAADKDRAITDRDAEIEMLKKPSPTQRSPRPQTTATVSEAQAVSHTALRGQ